MTKFGDLINVEIPVLIDFYAQWSDEEEETTGVVLRDVVAALGDKAKVIKIDIQKNEILANALKVKGNPTFVIYKNGVMKWRQSGEQDANTLISLVQQYV
ncbi:thioredoxin family protein [Wenyingzhuangia sp. IMCC45467]